MYPTDNPTIKALFYRQIKQLTKRSCGVDSFDLQYSDSYQGFRW